jgi:hypothetical protein
MKGDNEMETIQLFEIRFSSIIEWDLEPNCEYVLGLLESGAEMDSDEKAFAEFANAPRRIVVNREYNKTFAVAISIDAVKAVKKELLRRKAELEHARYDERDNRDGYRAFTSLINQCITVIKSCNKVLVEHG